LPAPEEARRLRHEAAQREREKRAKRPSEIRRKQARAERRRLLHESFEAESADRSATPFFEIFAEAFDLADPDLWKSNSFAMLRPRLVIEAKAAIAHLEYTLHLNKRSWPEDVARLLRGRKILVLLEDKSAP
jgi:hypothetical protein